LQVRALPGASQILEPIGERLYKLTNQQAKTQYPRCPLFLKLKHLSLQANGFGPDQSQATVSISDAMMPGLMTAVKGLDKSRGLDLILHTPGGEINATEQIVFYLREVFNGDIRAIVPHLAMSAGTMIASPAKASSWDCIPT
jgi:membrane-bound ClpP family serine protease